MPIGDLITAVLIVISLVFALWLAITVAVDVIRASDLSGPAKALWLAAVVIAPLLGSVVYVIARGDTMERRAEEHRRAVAARERERIEADTHMDVDTELAKLADLRDRGVISAEDFEDQKARLGG